MDIFLYGLHIQVQNMQCFKHEKCITSLVGIHEANDGMEGEDSVWGPRKRIFLLSLSVLRRFKTVLAMYLNIYDVQTI